MSKQELFAKLTIKVVHKALRDCYNIQFPSEKQWEKKDD